MRVFWVFILLLIVAGGAALGLRMRSQSPGGATAPISEPPSARAMPVATDTRTPEPPATSVGTDPVAPRNVPADDALAPVATAASSATEPPRIEELLPSPTAYDPEGLSTSGSTMILREVPVGLTSDTPGAPAAEVSASAFALPISERFPVERLFPAKAERTSDGAVMLDGRFAVPGSGTAEDPYRLTWDLLVSAQETYKPRLGQTRLPQRVAWLDGKHVRVSGFIAFPIASNNPQELLVMLNQWDGCCLGVPPTAYDAAEVKLASPASPAQRMSVHGTLTGRMKVDPYEDQGWLLGLYIIEDAKLVVDQ